jgi:aminopeptidase N
VRDTYKDGSFTLTFRQSTAPTPGQNVKNPRVIPIAVGLLNDAGDEIVPTTVLEMTEAEQSFTFEGLSARPIPSILREFSAPVVLERETTATERTFLLAHDTDPFNRWEAGRALAREARIAMITDGAAPDAAYLEALMSLVRDDTLDAAFRALVLSPPSQSEIAQALHDAGTTPDPDAIHDAAETFSQTLAQAMADSLPRLHAATTVDGPYVPDAEGAGKRALNAAILGLLSRTDGGEAAAKQYEAADNMTLQLSALACLLRIEKGADQSAAFFEQWKDDRLVMDKWFALQVSMARPEAAADTARALCHHTLFDIKNPNRFRAVIGALAGHHAGFHQASGAGYQLLAEKLIALDALNPQTTARMCAAFQTWKRYDSARQATMRVELERILSTEGLSRDTNEMVSRILDA